MSEKVVGYLLLFCGLSIMVFAFFQIYLVFTSQAKVPKLFGSNVLPSQSLTPSQMLSGGSLLNPNQPLPSINLIPQATLNETLNTIAYYFLMSFVLGFGFKISTLGIQMLRPIVVKLKAREIEVVEHEGHEKVHKEEEIKEL